MFSESHRLLRASLIVTVLALVGIPLGASAQDQPADQPAEPEQPPDSDAAEQPQDTSANEQPQETPPVQPAPAIPDEPPPAPEASPDQAVPDAAASPDAPVGDQIDPSQAEVSLEGDPIEEEGEVIVVTGSAIRRRITTTPAPVAVLDKAEIDASGLASVGDILQNLPAQSNAINVQFNNGGNGTTRVNLRGLGSARTLVLVNGRRHVPGGTGANSSVDLNAIPTAVIERVEVLKDGASAIYGSDAIGGVVNIITRQDFDGGAEAAGYLGSTPDGLGTVYDVSVTAGHSSERGNIMFSAGFYEQYKMMAGDRDFSKNDKSYNWQDRVESTMGSSSVPEGYVQNRQFVRDENGELVKDGDGNPIPIGGNDLWDEVINGSCQSGICFNDPDSGWRDFANTGNQDVGEGDQYNYQPENYLVTPQERYNIFSTGTYKFHDKVKGFFEASYTNRQSDQLLAPTPLTTYFESPAIVVDANNYYNPFGRDMLDVRRRFVEASNRHYMQNVDTFRSVVGLEGDAPDQIPFLKGWHWSASFNFGRTEGTSVNEGRFVKSRVEKALGPTFVDESGNIRCGTGPDDLDPVCVPLNLFGGPGTITPEMLNYISYTGTANGFTQQESLLVNATGKLVDTPWGGDVSLALGAEYRDESGGFEPDPLTASGDTTGNKGEPTLGGYEVVAAYGELSVVPVAGKPWAKWVQFDAAMRVFDYSSFGSDYTWKVGGLWRPHSAVSVRGTYSTAFRAPSIGELFSGNADDFPNVTDPCNTRTNDSDEDPRTPEAVTNCAIDEVPQGFYDDRTQIKTRVGGNPNLEAETANIFTAGIVIEPPMVPGLAFTVDYFNISIDNAIQPRGPAVILSQCYLQEDRDQQACDAIRRDPATGVIVGLSDTQDNIGGNDTAGIDFNLRYDHTTPFGRLRHNLEGTWLQKYDEIQPGGFVVKGKGVYDVGAFPEWKANYSLLWGLRQFGAGANVRFIGPFRECEQRACRREGVDEDTIPSRDIDPNFTGDLFVTYAFKTLAGQSKFTAGMNNVWDAKPAVIYNGFLASSDAATYDYLGRFMYARFSHAF
ncbi:MAG: TonB-dependent receptor [Proteobacteria bacterium]|nr:TonB-dependent receptor [Pseudomonadota bacterium]